MSILIEPAILNQGKESFTKALPRVFFGVKNRKKRFFQNCIFIFMNVLRMLDAYITLL